VLRTLYDYGPISRADVARQTGLTRTTVSDVVGDLIADGMASEVGRGPSSGGKAPILVSVVDDARHVIGLDLGEGAFVGALVNLRGEVRHSVELPIDGRDGADALELVYRLVDELLEAAAGPLLGIGVGTPGVIDTRTGTIRWAVNLDWQDLPLGRLLGERYGVPVNVANDSQAAALAEYTFGGDASRRPNLIAIKVGRGIGAGIVLNGALYQGDGFGAGEIGHIVVEDDGAQCHCGRFGCLETVASGPATVARARALGLDARTIDDVRMALERGDEAALEAARFAGRFLGRAVAGLIGALDIHEIVIHGPLAALGEPWLEAIRDEATRRSLPLLADAVEVRIARIATNETVLGASALLMTRELGLSLVR
jgi:predicted NBD/HSP70 family sugar kinase